MMNNPGPTYAVQSNPRKTPSETIHSKMNNGKSQSSFSRSCSCTPCTCKNTVCTCGNNNIYKK